MTSIGVRLVLWEVFPTLVNLFARSAITASMQHTSILPLVPLARMVMLQVIRDIGIPPLLGPLLQTCVLRLSTTTALGFFLLSS